MKVFSCRYGARMVRAREAHFQNWGDPLPRQAEGLLGVR